MKIIIKNFLIKVHYFIKLVERYYNLFCQVYTIIIAKIFNIKSKLILQMFF